MAGIKNPKTLFVSGGMSGIGKALAHEYVGRGANVAIFDLVVEDAVLQELDNARQNKTQKIVAFQASVTDFEQLAIVVGQAVEAIGPPELAINCAGIQRAQPFGELPREDFELVVQVNMFGSRNFAAAVLPSMQRGARLVQEAMRGIFAGLDAGRSVIIPGVKAKLTYLCNRYLPDFIMNVVVDRIVRFELKKMEGYNRSPDGLSQ